jgi:ABC-type nitrate/sulfonate/bicarbonate transport system permease component
MYQNSWTNKLFIIVVIAVSWQLASFAIGNKMLWPDIWDVVKKLFELVQRVNFLNAVFSSLYITFTGFILMMVIVILVATATHNSKWARTLISDFCDIIGPTPTLSWLPVFLIFFGFSKATIYILMIWAVFWLAIPGFYSLLDISNQTWSKQIDNLRLSRLQAVKHVYIPSMLNGFLIISKINLMFMWRVLFSLEIVFGAVGGHVGIGTAMYDFKGKFDHLEVYACMLMIMIIGALINKFFAYFEMKKHDPANIL